jgi:hypothetical protein
MSEGAGGGGGGCGAPAAGRTLSVGWVVIFLIRYWG